MCVKFEYDALPCGIKTYVLTLSREDLNKQIEAVALSGISV